MARAPVSATRSTELHRGRIFGHDFVGSERDGTSDDDSMILLDERRLRNQLNASWTHQYQRAERICLNRRTQQNTAKTWKLVSCRKLVACISLRATACLRLMAGSPRKVVSETDSEHVVTRFARRCCAIHVNPAL